MELVPYEPDKGMEGRKPLPDGTVFIPLEELPGNATTKQEEQPQNQPPTQD